MKIKYVPGYSSYIDGETWNFTSSQFDVVSRSLPSATKVYSDGVKSRDNWPIAPHLEWDNPNHITVFASLKHED